MCFGTYSAFCSSYGVGPIYFHLDCTIVVSQQIFMAHFVGIELGNHRSRLEAYILFKGYNTVLQKVIVNFKFWQPFWKPSWIFLPFQLSNLIITIINVFLNPQNIQVDTKITFLAALGTSALTVSWVIHDEQGLPSTRFFILETGYPHVLHQ